MLAFREMEVTDRDWAQPVMTACQRRGSEYTFTNLYTWRYIFHTRICLAEGHVFSLSNIGTDEQYMIPMGPRPVEMIARLIEDAAERGYRLAVHSVPEDLVPAIEAAYPGLFSFRESENYFDYLYTREKLAELAGKKLHGKRNHIARFLENNPDWSYEEITRENIEEVRQMSLLWCLENGCKDSDKKDLANEYCATKNSIAFFEELGLAGGLIRAGGRVVAYSMGEQINDTLVVHIEKAFSEIQGAYPIINREFVRHAGAHAAYINREDDTGDPGLRRAKESYYPDLLYRRWVAMINEP